jgi:hypothetical protein
MIILLETLIFGSHRRKLFTSGFAIRMIQHAASQPREFIVRFCFMLKFLLPQRTMLGRQGMTQIFGNHQVLSMAIFKTGRFGARKQGQGVENPA